MKENDIKIKKKRDWKKIFSRIALISFLAPIIFLIVKLILPSEMTLNDRSDYVLMLVQCILGIVVLFLPSMASRKFRIEIPSGIYCLYIVFLYCAIFLGEVRSFYYNVPNWDTYLHTFSGAMIGALGFSVLTLLNKEEKIHVKLSPIFVSIFAFCFSMAAGAVWEIYEFTIDSIMQLNMQKYATEAGELIIGRAALMDTMKDIIVDALGALAMSVIGYISLKYKKGWVEKLIFKRHRDIIANEPKAACSQTRAEETEDKRKEYIAQIEGAIECLDEAEKEIDLK